MWYTRWVEVTYLIRTYTDKVLSAGTMQTVKAGTKVEGWLECDGSEYDPEQYPELHKVLTQEQVILEKRTWWQKLLGKKAKIIGYRTVGVYGENRLPDLRGKIVR